jgi:hypothetical protein
MVHSWCGARLAGLEIRRFLPNMGDLAATAAQAGEYGV